jgi:phenylpropionate dioxygenase-like ring-hydroxylating dioxygenase large terminal subunit
MWPLREGYDYPRNQWYVAGWSNEVSAETPIERWILGEPVALYRDQEGKAIALEGRCPHRNFPLAKGIIRGDALECGYHGFTFAPDGKCIRIPSQATIPPACKIKSYPLVERWKILWIWPGDSQLADEALIPDHDEIRLTSPGWLAVQCVTNTINCRPQLLHENLTDISHLSFLHAGTIGTDTIAKTEVEVTRTDNFVRGSRFIKNETLTGFFSEVLDYTGLVDRAVMIDFYAPSIHVALESFRYPGTDDPIGEFRVHHMVTPATPTSTNYFVAWSRTFALDDDKVTDTMNQIFAGVIDEDIEASEAIEQMISRIEQPQELLVKADKHSIMGRRWMEDLIADELSN